MEKQASAPKPHSSSKKVMSKLLPKGAITSGVFFDHHHHENGNKLRVGYPTAAGRRGFSGPIVSMIPPEARRETKNGVSLFDSQEPTSPKVSCMGQLVMKPRKKNNKKLPSDKILTASTQSSTRSSFGKKNVGAPFPERSSPMKLSTMFRRMLLPNGRKSSAAGSAADAQIETVPNNTSSRAAPPALCGMKRFSSGRDAFASFDWSSTTTDKVCDRSRTYCSDDDEDVLMGGCSDDDEDDKDFKIPFSAPIGGRGGVPVALEQRKEINLWKRRTMAPPRSLQLKI